MLVLSRRADEKIVFPQTGITVHVLGVRGNVVRIGVEAPPEIKVLRDELIGAKAAARKAQSKQRTLLVEDNANERELLAGLLSLAGCQCDTAEDGQAALDFLASHERPDFVLLDMWMPRCDGPQTVERIRRDPRMAGLKVFAVSGTPPQDLGVPTGPAGIDAWFPKPINPRTLWEAIQEHMTTPAGN